MQLSERVPEMDFYQPLVRDDNRIIRESVKIISHQTGTKRSKVLNDLIMTGLHTSAKALPEIQELMKEKNQG